MEEQINFTEQEVQQIRDISLQVQSAFQRLGEIQIRIKQFEDARAKIMNEYESIRQQEQQLFSELNQKYGDGNYDPETNIFIPNKKEEQEVTNSTT